MIALMIGTAFINIAAIVFTGYRVIMIAVDNKPTKAWRIMRAFLLLGLLLAIGLIARVIIQENMAH